MAKSRIMDSTSLPTKPTSVYLLASTFTNGRRIIVESRLAISVFPTPVLPIIRIFLGITSFCNSGVSCILLYLFRKATAIVFFAFFCPITYLSKNRTISFGVRLVDTVLLN